MTFAELFKKLDINDSDIGQLAYILDAPQSMFDVVKDDMVKAMIDDFGTEEMLKEINNTDLTLTEIKQDMIDTYNLFSEAFESGELGELPQDRVDFFLDLLAALRDKCLELPERKTIEIIIEKIVEDAVIPTYAHSTDAGADIYAIEDCEIPGNGTKIIGTGLKVAIPVGWELQVRPRSGMSAKTPIRVANAPGTIDAGYRDEVGVICHNTSPYPYTIHEGDRIAQFVLAQSPMITWKEGKVSEIGENRKGGFGSTGK